MTQTEKYDKIIIKITEKGRFEDDAIGLDQYGKITIIKNGRKHLNQFVKVIISAINKNYNYAWVCEIEEK